jgi:predicted Fe-S protein YdhL (DUF1289 family)
VDFFKDEEFAMALFPKIQSPCPYIDRLSSLMDGETCRMCKRQVFDLTHMSDGERVAFMKGCSGEVCVTYKFPVRKVLAAAVAVATIGAPMAAAACDATDVVIVSGGGIKDPANVKFVENPGDSTIPQLPVVYENAGAKQTPAPNAQASATTAVSSRPAS